MTDEKNNCLDIKYVFEYVERMTKAERKVEEFRRVYSIFKKYCESGEFKPLDEKSGDILRAFNCVVDFILEEKNG